MVNFNIIFLLLFIFFIQQSITYNPPVVPLTNSLTAIYCHNSNQAGIMTIRCGINEKIRMLDAYDIVVKNKSYLPYQCLKKEKHFSIKHNDNLNNIDCKVHTSFTSACSGRENCTLHMQHIRLNHVNNNCHNQLIDYTITFFECISDVFIHDICSSQAITSAWGTLKTPNFPNPYTSNDDCWCKLSTQAQHRILLSVIIFQLIPYDQKCAGTGLYLQSSNEQRSTQCTYLQPGHNYLSDNNSLYINFYSRIPTVRGGFWIIYEASHPNAEVHLHCGLREKLGIPSEKTSLSTPVSSPYNHGWSRLAFNNPPNPITLPMNLIVTTPHSFLEKNFNINPSTTEIGAFTYPYGRLTTVELAYGTRGWFLKFPFGSSNMTMTKFLQTSTTQLPIIKWNSTWRYTRRQPFIRTFQTTSTTTTSTTIQTTTLKSTPMTTPATTSLHTITNENIIPFSSTTPSTTILQTVSIQPRLLFTHNLWIYYSSTSIKSSTTIKPTFHLPPSSFMLKTTLPSPTPWYPPAGPFDWWQWPRYTTKFKRISFETFTTTQKTITIPTTTKTTFYSTNKTSQTTISNKHETTIDWFKWPNIQFTTSIKERTEYNKKEYLDSPYYFSTNKISTTHSLTSISSEENQKSQQMNFFSTKSNKQFSSHIITNNTPPSKRHHEQQNISGIEERNTTEISLKENVMNTNIPSNTKQHSKKTSERYGWLSKTDMTIVIVSIIFIILLIIINFILYAVRRYRHRLRNQHLFNTSLPFSFNDEKTKSINQFQNIKLTDSTNNLINTTNDNNNDILPAFGEIVLWDKKDQGGYMIDNHGQWAKIDGHQWFGSNIFKNCGRASFSKSFRSRFQFIRQSKKKLNYHQQQTPITPKTQKTFKYPLLMDIPETDNYQSSEMSSEIPIKSHQQPKKNFQALVHIEQDQSDDYYKRIETNEDESNYTIMHGNIHEDYSITDQQTNRSLGNEIDVERSVIVSVPTMFKQDNDIDTITDGNESIYNQNYSMETIQTNNFQSNDKSSFSTKQSIKTYKPSRNNSIIIGHCQTDFQVLNPKLLNKSLLAEHQQLYNCSPSFQLSAYDSGYFDEHINDKLVKTSSSSSSSTTTVNTHDNLKNTNEIILNKSEDNVNNNISSIELNKLNRQKQKHVSFHS